MICNMIGVLKVLQRGSLHKGFISERRNVKISIVRMCMYNATKCFVMFYLLSSLSIYHKKYGRNDNRSCVTRIFYIVYVSKLTLMHYPLSRCNRVYLGYSGVLRQKTDQFEHALSYCKVIQLTGGVDNVGRVTFTNAHLRSRAA